MLDFVYYSHYTTLILLFSVYLSLFPLLDWNPLMAEICNFSSPRVLII